MIHVDLRQPLEHRISSAAKNPKVLLLSALQDPAMLASLFIALAAGTSTVVLERQLSARERSVEADLATADVEMRTLGDALERADELASEQSRIESRIEAIQTLDPDRYAFVRLMDEVARGTPANTWIDALVVDARDPGDGSLRFRIRGFSPSIELVSAFQRTLLASGAVGEAQLTGSSSTQIGDVPVIRFELSGITSDDADSGSPKDNFLPARDPGYALNGGVDAVNRESRP